MTAAGIAAALGAAYRSSDWWRCRCPAHQSKGSTLALRDDGGTLRVVCHAGCTRDDILAELQRLGLLDDDHELDAAELDRQRQADEQRRNRRIAAALDFWTLETEPVRPGSVIERYWLSRGLALPMPPTIRASRSWLHHPENGRRPGMVALVEHVTDGPVAVHRTFLAVDGSAKASFRAPRLSLGPVGGGAVQLAPANAHTPLLISEGIETAASVMLATGYPAWAALSAVGIERLALPPLPLAATIIIAADNDENGTGIRAARTVAARWLAEGREVRVALPPVTGSDWNDVLLNKDQGETSHAA